MSSLMKKATFDLGGGITKFGAPTQDLKTVEITRPDISATLQDIEAAEQLAAETAAPLEQKGGVTKKRKITKKRYICVCKDPHCGIGPFTEVLEETVEVDDV